MRKKEMEILANLKNIVILDCDKDALYKKVQTILLIALLFSVHLCFVVVCLCFQITQFI